MLDEERKKYYVARMVENLPVLRAKLKLTQKDLAEIIGVSNYSISGMEKGQRKMTWNTFMSIIPIFLGNEETYQLARILGIYTDELDAFLHSAPYVSLEDDDLDEVAAAGTGYPAGEKKLPGYMRKSK